MQYCEEEEELLMDDQHIEDIELDLDESIDLDNIDAMDSLEDFGDIEDLDSFDDIDEFAEPEEQKDLMENDSEAPVEAVEGFNEDYHRFSLIQSSINDFYKDSKYNSKFVEDIYIADAVGVSGDLKRYLEEEMFLNVFVRQLDLPSELCEIAKAELK